MYVPLLAYTMVRAIVDATEIIRYVESGLTITRGFGIKSGICPLIAPVPVHCFSLTFTGHLNDAQTFGLIRRIGTELCLT